MVKAVALIRARNGEPGRVGKGGKGPIGPAAVNAQPPAFLQK